MSHHYRKDGGLFFQYSGAFILIKSNDLFSFRPKNAVLRPALWMQCNDLQCTLAFLALDLAEIIGLMDFDILWRNKTESCSTDITNILLNFTWLYLFVLIIVPCHCLICFMSRPVRYLFHNYLGILQKKWPNEESIRVQSRLTDSRTWSWRTDHD